MNQLAPITVSGTLPALVTVAGDRASLRFMEFFGANIRNPHTRRAYMRAVTDFLAWCKDVGVSSIAQVQPLHVAGWVELQTRDHAAPTAKLRLASSVRLACYRPDRTGKPGRLSARPSPCREIRQNAGAGAGRSADLARQH
jgi:hypothetical protein